MHFAHSVNHEIAPVPRRGTQGDTAALMQDTFLLAFRQLLQKICKEKCENCRSSAELGQVSTEHRAVLKVAPALCQLPHYLLCQLLLN